jgi:hypothetical protein
LFAAKPAPPPPQQAKAQKDKKTIARIKKLIKYKK